VACGGGGGAWRGIVVLSVNTHLLLALLGDGGAAAHTAVGGHEGFDQLVEDLDAGGDAGGRHLPGTRGAWVY
jgi:hypothetical protein